MSFKSQTKKLVTMTSKRGLAWESVGPASHPDDVLLFSGHGKISWAYNWSPHPRGLERAKDIDFIPMQWNGVYIEQLAEHVAARRPAVILVGSEIYAVDRPL